MCSALFKSCVIQAITYSSYHSDRYPVAYWSFLAASEQPPAGYHRELRHCYWQAMAAGIADTVELVRKPALAGGTTVGATYELADGKSWG